MKRGSFQDLIFIGALAFAIIIFGFVFYYAINQTVTNMNTGLVAAGADANVTTSLNGATNAASGFVLGLPLGIFFGGLILVALASFIPVSPVFLPLGIIMLVVSMLFFVYLQDAARNVLGQTFFVPLALQFPLAAAFLNNIALFAGVIGILLLIVMYGKVKNSNSGGAPEG